MTVFFQAFFFFFYRKRRKTASYPHFGAAFSGIFAAPPAPPIEMPFFAKFQGFNIFENRINPTYQQLINLCEVKPNQVPPPPALFCNFIFTFKNFTLVYIQGPRDVTGNIKGTHNRVLPFFYMEFRHH